MTEYNENDFETNYELAEAEALLEKLGAGMMAKQQKMAAAQQQKLTGEGMNEALTELGMTQDQWNQIMRTADPVTAQQYFKEGVKNYVKNVATKARDPKTGQFVKAQPNQAQRQVQTQTTENRQAGLKEIRQNTQGSDDDISDMFDVMLPDDDPFFQD